MSYPDGISFRSLHLEPNKSMTNDVIYVSWCHTQPSGVGYLAHLSTLIDVLLMTYEKCDRKGSFVVGDKAARLISLADIGCSGYSYEKQLSDGRRLLTKLKRLVEVSVDDCYADYDIELVDDDFLQPYAKITIVDISRDDEPGVLDRMTDI